MESDEAECGRGSDTVLRAGNEVVRSPGTRLGSPGGGLDSPVGGLAPNCRVVSPPSGNNTTPAGDINVKVKYYFLNYAL